MNRCAFTQATVPPDPVSGLGFRVEGVGLQVGGCEGSGVGVRVCTIHTRRRILVSRYEEEDTCKSL